MNVIKRDTTVQPFDRNKILGVLLKAFGKADGVPLDKLVDDVLSRIEEESGYPCHVENIQDIVERVLDDHGYWDVVRKYIVYREQRRAYREQHGSRPKDVCDVVTPWGPAGEILFAHKFGAKETIEGVADRVIKGCQEQLGVGMTMAEMSDAKRMIMGMKCSFSERLLRRIGTPALENANVLAVADKVTVPIDGPYDVSLAMEALLMGCRVDAIVCRDQVASWQRLMDKKVSVEPADIAVADFIVTDTNTGWCELVRKAILAYMNGEGFTYSLMLIRRGDGCLLRAVQHITALMASRKGNKLESTDIQKLLCGVAAITTFTKSELCIVGEDLRCEAECPTYGLYNGKSRVDLDGLVKKSCVVPETIVLTANGLRTVKELVGEKFDAIIDGVTCGSGESGFSRVGVREVVRVTLENGLTVDATEDHMFQVPGYGRTWSKVEDLVVGKSELCLDTGLLHMDAVKLYTRYSGLVQVIRDTLMSMGKITIRRMQSVVLVCDARREVLGGMNFQHLLLAMGVPGTVVSDGIHLEWSAASRLAEIVPWFSDEFNIQPSNAVCADLFRSKVTSIRSIGQHPVYDCSISTMTSFWANGMVAHNCGFDHEASCMAEVFLPNIKNEEELAGAVKLLYRVCKKASLLPRPNSAPGMDVHLGICISGYHQATEEQKGWLPRANQELRQLDKSYSDEYMISCATKLTAVKPVNSLAPCAGFTPGVGVCVSSGILLVSANADVYDTCKKLGYKSYPVMNLDGEWDRSQMLCRIGAAFVDVKLTTREQFAYATDIISKWATDDKSIEIVYADENDVLAGMSEVKFDRVSLYKENAP